MEYEILSRINSLAEQIDELTDQIIELKKAVAKATTVQAKEVLNMVEVAQLTGLSRSHIYKLIWARKIPCYKDPIGRRLHFKRSEIESWMLAHRVPTMAEVEQMAGEYCRAKEVRESK